MSRKTQTVLGVLSLLLALVSGGGAYWFLGTFAAMTTVPVPRQIIPAGALISPALLVDREVPRTLLQEPIYTSVDDLQGKVAQIPLYPGVAVYHHHAVPLREYRFVDDPSLVVVSLPVDPSRAVGGQIQPGHLVDLWQLPQTRGQQEEETTPLTATLVLSDVLVVDVRASQGQAVARRPQAVPGQVQGNTSSSQPSAANVPLQILTVALPVNQTGTLMDWLTAEENGVAVLWVTLAPVVRPTPLASPAASAAAMEVAAETPPPPAPTSTPAPANTSSPLPTATATPLPTPTPMPGYRVTSTEGALQVRAEPPQGTVLGTLPQGTVVFALAEPRDVDGTLWYHITTEGNGITLENPLNGWVSGAYLEAITP